MTKAAPRAKITFTLTLNESSPETVAMIADRINHTIRQEWMAGGEDLMGYDGPMVLTVQTEVTA